MFRNPVKSQAPSESQTSLRLTAIERKISSLEHGSHSKFLEKGRMMDSRKAADLINDLMDAEIPRGMIVEEMVRRGAPEAWVTRRLERSDY